MQKHTILAIVVGLAGIIIILSVTAYSSLPAEPKEIQQIDVDKVNSTICEDILRLSETPEEYETAKLFALTKFGVKCP